MLSSELKDHLWGRLIPFWKRLRDTQYGGYYGWMDSDLVVDRQAVKGCILNSRILWFFSNAQICLRKAGDDEAAGEGRGQGDGEGSLREHAQWAYRFLKEKCMDAGRGGVYWSLDYRGEPADTTKHTYNQAFAVYGLSSYYRAYREAEALELAERLIEVIEGKCFDGHGYREALDVDFAPIANDKLSENGVMADRTMNTLLHVMEAYTEYLLACRERRLAKADGSKERVRLCCDESRKPPREEGAGEEPGRGKGKTGASQEWEQVVEQKLRWILNLVADRVYNPKLCRQEVFFNLEMESLIDLHSYGHDIEAAWLIDRCLEVLGDKGLTEKMSPILRSLENEVYERAYANHSLANECERGVVDEKRVWWVQAEGIVGFSNAWRRTGEPRFREAAEDIWRFVKAHLVDSRAEGEWFWYTDASGNPALEKPIVEPWKCPYHNGRMCMELTKAELESGGIMLHPNYEKELAKQQQLLDRPNEAEDSFENGIYTRYRYPVLTREHIPLFWRYDLDRETNPFFQERLGVNAVMNSGAIELDGKFYLVARVEGNDRKSFFAVAESDSPVEGFRFWDYPVVLPDTCPEETNVYDMRLTKHEDGYIYGVFCSESKDTSVSDLSAAVAAAGIVRTKDLRSWERLPNLKTLQSPQQRNVVLHPEFVEGKYAFYTRPMDDFIDTGSGGGIGFGLCQDILHPVIDEERITSKRRYHTITEAKNGAGAVPIKTPDGWIHIAHGVRNTAAGLRYVIYAFATALEDPAKVIAEPGGLLIGPRGGERVGDVSNVVFTNGAIARENGEVYIYYASSDTRMHVAATTIERLTDYVFHTPEDPLRSPDCVAQRCGLIEKNLKLLRG